MKYTNIVKIGSQIIQTNIFSGRQTYLQTDPDKMSNKRSRSREREKKRKKRRNETDIEKEKRNTADRENKKNARQAETVAEKVKRNTADRENKKNVTRADRNVLGATRTDVAPFSVGLMNQVCSCCSSLMFAGETHRGQLGVNGEPGSASFSMCCR